MIDGEDFVERICKRVGIDIHKIPEEEWQRARREGEELIELMIESQIDEMGREFVSDLGLNKYLPSKEEKEVEKK